MSVEGTPSIPIAYPARLEVDYSAQYDRVKTLFRAVLIIPIAIIYGVLTAGVTRTVYDQNGQSVSTTSGGIAAGLFTATLLMILFRQRYPRWWFDFALELTRLELVSVPTLRCSPTSTPRRSRSRRSTSRSIIPTPRTT